jgi:hypothetical protein
MDACDDLVSFGTINTSILEHLGADICGEASVNMLQMDISNMSLVSPLPH